MPKKAQKDTQQPKPKGHTPMAAELAKLQAESREAERRKKFATIYAYADEVKSRHPDMPTEVISKIEQCSTAGEAKRIVKAHLTALPART